MATNLKSKNSKSKIAAWESIEEFGNYPSQLHRFILVYNSIKKENNGKARVLDIGCGLGGGLQYLAERELFVVGADISSKSLEQAKKRAKNVLKCDATNLPFQKNSFDYIVCTSTLHHLLGNQRERATKEIRRVMSKCGLCAIAVFSDKDGGFGHGGEEEENTFEAAPGINIHYFAETELKELFSEFKILHLSHDTGVDNTHAHPHTHNYWTLICEK